MRKKTMFDSKEIAAYRNISAPNDLRDRVLSSCGSFAPKKRDSRALIRHLSSLAACFVLAAVLVMLVVQDLSTVSVSVSNDELIKEQTVVYAPNDGIQGYSVARTSETKVELTLDGHAELSVSNGMLNIYGAANDDKLLYTGTDCSVHGKTLVCWVVGADDQTTTYEMTVRSAFKTEKIILTYEASDDTWTLTRSEIE